jgi:hypothetical protein
MGYFRLLILLLTPLLLPGQEWRNLFNGSDLSGWEVRGDGAWTVLKDGTLFCRRTPPDAKAPFGAWPVDEKQFRSWRGRQAWLYTKRNDFDEFDLQLEYLLGPGGNSGVSIRDTSRGENAVSGGPTPSHIGYEIQISQNPAGKYPSGSIYLLARATGKYDRECDWNKLEIQSRRDLMRVLVNGQLAAEHTGEPNRPKVGPIGLQIHDAFTWIMYRNIRIREIRH